MIILTSRSGYDGGYDSNNHKKRRIPAKHDMVFYSPWHAASSKSLSCTDTVIVQIISQIWCEESALRDFCSSHLRSV